MESGVSRRGSRGAALLEFSVTLPALLIIILGILDLGSLIYEYMSVQRVAYEGARYAASLADLEEGPGYLPAPEEGPPVLQTVHGQLRTRIERLLDDGQLDGNEATFSTLRQGDIVSVTVSVRHTALALKWLDQNEVSVSSSAPYLYPED